MLKVPSGKLECCSYAHNGCGSAAKPGTVAFSKTSQSKLAAVTAWDGSGRTKTPPAEAKGAVVADLALGGAGGCVQIVAGEVDRLRYD